jgi:hypothetical protein
MPLFLMKDEMDIITNSGRAFLCMSKQSALDLGSIVGFVSRNPGEMRPFLHLHNYHLLRPDEYTTFFQDINTTQGDMVRKNLWVEIGKNYRMVTARDGIYVVTHEIEALD